MSTDARTTMAPITHEISIDAGPAEAFDAFASRLGAWWPLAYTFSLTDFADAAIDPRVGGRWFERNRAGDTLSWGDVRAYEPGRRLVLGFAIGPDRQPVPNDRASELDVRFSTDGAGANATRTRVTLEHRKFEAHGEGAEALRTGMDSAAGWPLILAELQRWIRLRSGSR